ncbi:pyridoxamine 5'-phosphate oxidase family protein [Paraflavitalea soli]|nr:pyridoxamine 5'-phosphate oxidase family protein [Paraflavitalea soli]
MLSDIQVGFLRDRIHEIGSALFSNTGNATFKLPTSIISVLRVDEEGNIWFFLHNPDLFIEEGDKAFPARLDFYRKGKPFFLQVSGEALVITDAAEIKDLTGSTASPVLHSFSRVMLVKVRVEHASYFEQRERRMSRLQSWWHAICKYLLQEKPSLRPYKLHPMILA